MGARKKRGACSHLLQKSEEDGDEEEEVEKLLQGRSVRLTHLHPT